MLTVDDAGWFKTDEVGDPEIRIVPTARIGKLRDFPCSTSSPPVGWPIAHIDHSTDLFVSMEVLCRRIVPDPTGVGASWHVGIARDGVLWQSAPFIRSTRHVGNPGTIEGHTVLNVNRCTISTEEENPGRLRKSDDGHYYTWPFWKAGADGKPSRLLGFDPHCRLPDKDPYGQPWVMVAADGGWWADFTPAQLVAKEAMVRAVAAWRPVGLPAGAEPPLGRASAWRYGHVDFPGKSGKEDPGPLYVAHREVILAKVFPHQAPTGPPTGSAA